MTQEDKKLLLKDLCARLTYGVLGVHVLDGTIWSEKPETIVNIDLQKEKIWTNDAIQGYNIEDQEFKPYLRLMSSMTEEENEEYWIRINNDAPEMPINEIPSIENIAKCSEVVLDWLNAHHFDYRGLIERGLALEAPEDMYK